MQDFPANSAKARSRSEGPQGERPERIERITSAEAERRKTPLGRKFKETFVGGTARGAIDFMIVDVVIPAIQDTLIEAFQGGIERLIKGESRRPRRYGPMSSMYSDNPPRVDYTQNFARNRPPTSSTSTRMLSRQARSRHNFDEIVIESRAEAQDVLDQMYDWLSRYGIVKVSELYAMTGIPTSHTDTKWGWASLPGARLQRLRDGRFVLDLPEPQPL